jgi:hypothetical protein
VLIWFSPSALKEFPSCSFLRSIRPDFLCSAPFSTREFSDCRVHVDFPPSLLRLDFCRIPLHGLALTRSIYSIHRDRASHFHFVAGLWCCLREYSSSPSGLNCLASSTVSCSGLDFVLRARQGLALLPQFGQVQASVLCPEAKTAQRLCFLRFCWAKIWIVAVTYPGHIFKLSD